MRELEIRLGQLVVTYAVLEALAFALAMVVLYYVLKAAIRDGINESAIGSSKQRRWFEPMADAHPPPATRAGTDTLPDMRADR